MPHPFFSAGTFSMSISLPLVCRLSCRQALRLFYCYPVVVSASVYTFSTCRVIKWRSESVHTSNKDIRDVTLFQFPSVRFPQVYVPFPFGMLIIWHPSLRNALHGEALCQEALVYFVSHLKRLQRYSRTYYCREVVSMAAHSIDGLLHYVLYSTFPSGMYCSNAVLSVVI